MFKVLAMNPRYHDLEAKHSNFPFRDNGNLRMKSEEVLYVTPKTYSEVFEPLVV